MGRLIKYELKKQQTSRNIILALLLVFLLAVVVGTFTENGNTVGISVMLEMFVGMFVFFYMGIESLLILNRDLKTKQSHMLWMVPMQSWKILGAKYIAAILQIFFISAAYVLAAIACILSLIAKMDAWEELFKGLRIGAEWLFQGNMDWITLMAIFLFFFLAWTCVIATGFSGSHCIQNGVDQFQICGHCFIHFVLCDQWNCGIYLQSVCQIRTYGNP